MTGKEKHILIVDDEPGFHELFRFILEPLGFTVSSAYNGLEGLERLKEHEYDIIFLDVHMPKMTGPELLKLIKGIKPLQLVVIMSSGSDPRQAFETTVKGLGAAACMFKPFELHQIMKNLERIPCAST
ncbi:MAG: hypothetical protein A2X34_02090 [Elusimicrobia bacterium GWC2_51_8]|nr:MAG: hypothetical protein A2X33_07150 [Elusimicrobia bacterium GWA2_51_34]OGR60046.1 MAG: hypothetical protein A2X34_02090 [Elusimicrobia bacterium GWC2_51_8]HAF95323.1 response regulator [Elusimicrobiota bacterium]HCE96905.1 response regulator [Elusimicrobiota bacterium]